MQSLSHTPSELRSRVLRLYALLGPFFLVSLLVLGRRQDDLRSLLVIAAVIASGAFWLLLRRSPKLHDWIFPVAIAPAVCCGIGYVTCGERGAAYLAVLGAPLAWTAVLFEWPVVLAALATANITVFAALSVRLGPAAAALSTLMLSPVAGLVAWVVFATANRLRAARLQLRASQEQLALAVEGSELAAWDWDLRTDRTGYSSRWPALLGYGPEEIRASFHAWAALVHPDDALRVNGVVVAHIKDQSPGIDTEYRMHAKGGAWQWIHTRAKVVERDEHGRAVRLAGTHADVTGRREVAERLREAHAANERLIAELQATEERLRLALASGTHAEWDWDVAHDRFSVGRSWSEMLGVDRDQVSADLAGWRSVVHPEDLPQAWNALHDCVEGRTSSYEGHYRVRHARDGWRWIRSRARAISRGPDGRALRITGTRTDVTEVTNLQERLLAATRLASVGTLAAGVAHEINNPLAWVTANLSFVIEEMKDSGESCDRSEVREALAEAKEGAARIAAIVKSMRSLGRPEQSEEPSDVNVRAELLSAVQMVRNQIVQRAALEVRVPEELPVVRARTNELGRVFLNFLVNAAQAIPEGRADRHRITVLARLSGDSIVVEIADTGVGMTKEVRERIFDAFFTTKPVGVGTGLGLSIARSIVEGAGGKIEIDSELGRGSTFRVLLPTAGGLMASTTVRHVPVAVPACASPRRDVLVIDDEPLVRRALERTLSRSHDVTAVGSAREALQCIDAGRRFDAVLCDLMMPDIDGTEFYGALTSRNPLWRSRVVFLTGGVFGERVAQFLAENPVSTLPKPIEPAALLATIDALPPCRW
jgi:PAS domain S-box-containing protein